MQRIAHPLFLALSAALAVSAGPAFAVPTLYDLQGTVRGVVGDGSAVTGTLVFDPDLAQTPLENGEPVPFDPEDANTFPFVAGNDIDLILTAFGQTFTGADDIGAPLFPQVLIDDLGRPRVLDVVISEVDFSNPTPIDEPGIVELVIMEIMLEEPDASSALFSAFAPLSLAASEPVFGGVIRFTLFAAFDPTAIRPVPLPASGPLLLLALGVALWRRQPARRAKARAS